MAKRVLSTLQMAWIDVRRDFFPRFNPSGNWHARKGTFTSIPGELGYCDSDRHRIMISPQVALTYDDRLTVTFIHELTHAVLRDASHGQRFLHRLEKTKARALTLGRQRLAAAIEDEIDAYGEKAERITAPAVYSHMRNIVIERAPRTYSEAIRILARQYPRAYLDK